MSAPAFTLQNLQALTDAIAQGATRVKYSDKEIEYRSLDAMLTLRRIMLKELGFQTTTSGQRFAYYDKGIYSND